MSQVAMMSDLETVRAPAAVAPYRQLFTLVFVTKSKPLFSSPTTPTTTITTDHANTSYSLITSPYSSVLLGYKKRGFGSGKYNGFGGKLEPGESVRAAALREMKEEAGIDVVESSMTKRGVLLHEFEGDPCTCETHVYLAHEYSGSLVESEEMRPEWFDCTNDTSIPFKTMWVDDSLWYPWLLNDQYFHAHFFFRDQAHLLSHNIQRLSEEEKKKMLEEDRL